MYVVCVCQIDRLARDAYDIFYLAAFKRHLPIAVSAPAIYIFTA